MQESYRNIQIEGKSGMFVIDQFLGRDVKLTTDKSTSGTILQIQLMFTNGTVFWNSLGDDIDDTFSKTFDLLEVSCLYFIHKVIDKVFI